MVMTTLAAASAANATTLGDPGFEATGPMQTYDFGTFSANPLGTWLNSSFGPEYFLDPNATDQVLFGSQSLKLSATQTTDDGAKWEKAEAKQLFQVAPGQVINGSAWLKWENLTGTIQTQIECKWLKANGQEFTALETPQPGIGTAAITGGSGNWQLQDLSTWSVAQRTAPVGAAYVDIRLLLLSPGGADVATGTVWWDNVSFTVIPEPSTYGMLGAGVVGMLGLLGFKKRKV
jgi:PEP-CTERM motif-containing protein